MRFISLICEFKELDKDGEKVTENFISLGRVSFWITFLICLKFWWYGKDIPMTLYNTFVVMVIYNFSKKGLRTVENIDFGKMFKK